MDNLTGNYASETTRPKPLAVIVQTVKGIYKRLEGFFTVTEKERKDAGIDIGSKDHEE
jgi:hypothetical protein